MPKVAVVILNWNGVDFLKSFLPNVIKYTNSNDNKVYVADNGSDDNSLFYLNSVLEEEYIIKLDKNYGFALGYDIALKQIGAKYFVLLNSDVEVSENWVDPIIEYLDCNHDIAAAMPKIKSYNQRNYFEYAGAAGGYIDKYGYPYCRGRILNVTEIDKGQYNDIRQIFWATGACLFVKSELYFKCGGLDGDFFAHMEEIDLCWRLNNMGYKIIVFPKIQVFHVGGGTLASDNPRKVYYNFRNSLYLLYKNLPKKGFKRRFLFRLVLDGIAAMKFFAGFKITFFIAILKAHLHFWKNLSTIKEKRQNSLKLQISIPSISPSNTSVIINFFIKGKKFFSQF